MQAFELSADNKPDHRTVSHLASIHFKWTFAQSSDSEFTHDFFFRDGALTCIWGWHIFIHRQQFPKVFLSPCSDFQLRVQRSQTWFWTLSPVHRDFSRFSLLMIFHVDDEMLKVFTILQCGTLFWNCSIIWWWIFFYRPLPIFAFEKLWRKTIFTPNPITDLLPIANHFSKCRLHIRPCEKSSCVQMKKKKNIDAYLWAVVFKTHRT